MLLYHLSKKKLFWGLLAALILTQACRSASPPEPAAPAVMPTATTLLPTPTPTPIISGQLVLQNYTHPSQRFSLELPENWKFFERDDGVVLLHPSNKAGYSVAFNDVGQVYSEQELNQYLVSFVAKNFLGDGSNFEPINQETRNDGAIVAQFAWVDPNLGPTVSELQVYQKDTIVYVLHLSTAEEQWDLVKEELEQLTNTFTPLDTSPIPDSEPTAEPPVWTLIGPVDKEFGFFYASDWQIAEQSRNVVSVILPDQQLTFTASSFDWPHAMGDPDSAEKAALAHIENYDNVQNLPPAEFPLDTTTGATIDFIYKTDEGVDMAGSVITAAHQGKMYQVVFTAPAATYEQALEWFNPMYKSFRFLSPEDIITEEP
jgi:hypothetical protein